MKFNELHLGRSNNRLFSTVKWSIIVLGKFEFIIACHYTVQHPIKNGTVLMMWRIYYVKVNILNFCCGGFSLQIHNILRKLSIKCYHNYKVKRCVTSLLRPVCVNWETLAFLPQKTEAQTIGKIGQFPGRYNSFPAKINNIIPRTQP